MLLIIKEILVLPKNGGCPPRNYFENNFVERWESWFSGREVPLGGGFGGALYATLYKVRV
jgi:hypothetical protein